MPSYIIHYMQHDVEARKTIDVVKRYYKKHFGPLNIGFDQICFCQHNALCKITTSPITIPNDEQNRIQIHISSSIDPKWYPGQLVFQLAHEIWHAYEFSRYGIDYPWQEYQEEAEPFAHAASLCILSEHILPASLSTRKQQLEYFDENKLTVPGNKIYEPGIKIAKDVGYDFKKLCLLYDKKVASVIEAS